MLRPRHATVYTSEAVLCAEENLLTLAATSGPAVTGSLLGKVADDAVAQRIVSRSQADAVDLGACGGRAVGPAGTGKTTTMRLLHAAWENTHGAGSVVGLAPSASAAEVLAGELRIGCENTAKWLWDHGGGHAMFLPGQLVILDEASMAGTHTLNAITAHAAEMGAKVLLVGDPGQLSAVEAGGAFNLLVTERHRTTADVPELVDVHRFRAEWEKNASLRLRAGDTRVLAEYEEHNRIVAGTTEEVQEAAYQAWKADKLAGRTSILMAADGTTVTDLNRRARAELLLNGTVDDGRSVRLADDVEASAGDVILTRRNDRRLRYGRDGWVRNGNLWTVQEVHDDGSLTIRRLDPEHDDRKTRTSGNTPMGTASAQPCLVRLPAAYVAEHVDLGYASTIHTAEGITTHAGRVLVTPAMTREAAYVGATRGTDNNMLYVPVDQPDRDGNHAHAIDRAPDDDVPPPVLARAILASVLARTGVETSAHQTRREEQEQYGSIARLAAEYETIAQHAQRPRWTRLVTVSLRSQGLTERDIAGALASEAFGSLCAELRRAEADGYDVDRFLPHLAANRSLGDADDFVAVLHHRLAHATHQPATRHPVRIAGLISKALGDLPEDVRKALDERAELIERRAREFAGQAIRDGEAWTRRLPPRPYDASQEWHRHVVAVAAYRDLYGITGDHPSVARQRASLSVATRAASHPSSADSQ